MTDPMEQEREDLWQKIEELTGMRFINRRQMPEVHKEIQKRPLFSDEASPTLKLFLLVPTAWPGSGMLTKPMNQCLSLGY